MKLKSSEEWSSVSVSSVSKNYSNGDITLSDGEDNNNKKVMEESVVTLEIAIYIHRY